MYLYLLFIIYDDGAVDVDHGRQFVSEVGPKESVDYFSRWG